MKLTKKQIKEIEDILYVTDCGLDFESFENGDELALYLEGSILEVTNEEREKLNQIYSN